MVSAALAIVRRRAAGAGRHRVVPLVLGAASRSCSAASPSARRGRLGGLALFAASIGGLRRRAVREHRHGDRREHRHAPGLFASTLRFATPLVLGGARRRLLRALRRHQHRLEGMMLRAASGASGRRPRRSRGRRRGGDGGGRPVGAHPRVLLDPPGRDQIISGTAINILALGMTSFAYRSLTARPGTPDNVDRIPNVTCRLIADIPFIGDIIGDLNLMVWVMFALVGCSWVFLTRTAWGLRLRAVGEHPRAADTVGIDVYRVRYPASSSRGVLAGMAARSCRSARLIVQREHDRRPRVHRPGGGGVRQVAAVRRARAALLFGFARRWATPCRPAAGCTPTW